jgi:hypothetical protein
MMHEAHVSVSINMLFMLIHLHIVCCLLLFKTAEMGSSKKSGSLYSLFLLGKQELFLFSLTLSLFFYFSLIY